MRAVGLLVIAMSFGCGATVTPDGGAAEAGTDVQDDHVDVADADSLVCTGNGTFDCGTRAIADSICAGSQPCHVCVQRVDASGTPITWSALNEPSDCPCPPLSP